jgi:hypothetical protein
MTVSYVDDCVVSARGECYHMRPGGPVRRQLQIIDSGAVELEAHLAHAVANYAWV